MEYVAVAAAVAGGVSKIAQGRQAEDMYFKQAVQARTQARGESLKYQQQANAILKRSVETQAAARARAAAGGIDPFSGSSQFIMDLSAAEGLREFGISMDNAKLSSIQGEDQALQFITAGRRAKNRGLLEGIASMAGAGQSFGKIGGPQPSAPADVTNFGSASWARNYGNNYG